MAKKSIISEEDQNLDFSSNLLISIGRSGGNIFEIESHKISDKLDRKGKLINANYKAFTMTPHKVKKFDLMAKPGFVVINSELEIPLIRDRISDGPIYLYDEDEAIALKNEKNRTEAEKLKEDIEEFTEALNYLETLVEKEL